MWITSGSDKKVCGGEIKSYVVDILSWVCPLRLQSVYEWQEGSWIHGSEG